MTLDEQAASAARYVAHAVCLVRTPTGIAVFNALPAGARAPRELLTTLPEAEVVPFVLSLQTRGAQSFETQPPINLNELDELDIGDLL